MIIWLISVNLLSSFLFYFDKRAAISGRKRVPELWLHALELMGGVFGVIPMMYYIRHKNRKFAYYSVSWVILACWVILGLKIFRMI